MSLGIRVDLNEQISMIPITAEIRQRLGIPLLPFDEDSDLPSVPQSIAAICVQLCGRGLIAYVEASYCGGTGIQAFALYREGAAVGSPVVASDAINQALRAFSVRADGFRDEFEAVGLRRFRDTEDWARMQGLA